MCECGCVANDERYLFPAPGKKLYMLTLSKGCVECDGPAGISIERIDRKNIYYTQREDFTDGELKFEKWSDSEGVAIITGMLRHEFIKALSPQLVGTNIEDMANEKVIDEIDAEVILEEMFEASVVMPHFPPVTHAT
jgi:hypothetical protein